MTAATARAAAAVELALAADQFAQIDRYHLVTDVDVERLKDALRAYEQATWVEEEQ